MDTDWAAIQKAVEGIENGLGEWIVGRKNESGRRDLHSKVADISHASADRFLHERVDNLSGLVSALFSERTNIERVKRKIRDECGRIRLYRLEQEKGKSL
jgi:hypothetical protein